MVWFLIIIVVAVVGYAALFSDRPKKNTSSAPPTPPSFDVVILGCHCNCGYATPVFRKNERGEYEGTKMVHCAYQGTDVRSGSKCPFAEDHPDLLEKSVFEDFED